MSHNPENGLVSDDVLGFCNSKCGVVGKGPVNGVWNQVLRDSGEVSWRDFEEVGLKLQFAVFLAVYATVLGNGTCVVVTRVYSRVRNSSPVGTSKSLKK